MHSTTSTVHRKATVKPYSPGHSSLCERYRNTQPTSRGEFNTYAMSMAARVLPEATVRARKLQSWKLRSFGV